MDRYVRAILGFREAVMMSLHFSDGVDFDFLDQSVKRMVSEPEFRGVLEVGYAELLDLRASGGSVVSMPRKFISGSDPDLSFPVTWRWTRWGDDFPGENLLTEDFSKALRESAKHRAPFFADGICFVNDEAGKKIKRGVRVFVPVYRTWQPEMQSAFGPEDWERDYLGSVFATINLDPLLTELFDDSRRPLEMDLFHGSEASEENRVSGFKIKMSELPRPSPAKPADPFTEFSETINLYGVDWILKAYVTEFYKDRSEAGGFPRVYLALPLIFIGAILLALSSLVRIKSVQLADAGKKIVLNHLPKQDRALARWHNRKLENNLEDDWAELQTVTSGRSKLLTFLKQGSFISGIKSVSSHTWIWTGLVVVVGVILSGSLFVGAQSRALQTHSAEFEKNSNAMWNSVESHIEQREQSIQSLHQFLSRHGEKPFSEWRHLWREFQDRMAIERAESGLIEFGFGRIVEGAGTGVSLDGLSQEFGVDLSHLDPILDANGVVAVPLIADTVSKSVPSAVGLDLLSGPSQQKLALDQSEQGLRPRISASFLLPIESGPGKVPVFRMFITLNHPVIRSQEPAVDISQDKQRAWGFVYGTFSMDVMLASLFGTEASRDVEMDISVGPRHVPERTLTAGLQFAKQTGLKYRKPAPPAKIHGLEKFVEKMQYMQRWSIRFYSTDAMNDGAAIRNSWWTLYAGLALSCCLGGIVFTQSHGRDQAESLTIELNDAQSNLAKFSSEREKACHAIHDQVIQSIFAVSIGLKRMAATIDGLKQEDQLEVDALVGEMNGSLQQVTRDLRHLSWKMEPAPYETEFQVAIESLCDRLRALLGIHIHCNMDSAAALKLSDLIDSVVPIVQEGISNAYRHGHAGKIELSFKDELKNILIIIKDDGTGFDTSKCTNLGQGLQNMRSRAEAIGGRMEIISKFGVGTELHFSILQGVRV